MIDEPTPGAGPSVADRELRDEEANLDRSAFEDWPEKGYSGPQPWDLRELGLEQERRELAAEARAGDPDDVSPVVPGHGRPILATGTQGPAVRELAERLAVLGYETSVSRGENHFDVFDPSVESAVERFRADYGVAEDPSQFPRDPRNQAISHVAAWTWEAVIRASDREGYEG